MEPDTQRVQRLHDILSNTREHEAKVAGTRKITYRGDRTGPYDHATGTGVIGKVIGPNARGQWFVALDAGYDDATDRTTVELQAIRAPHEQAGL